MYARRTHGLLCAQRVRLSRVFLVAAWPRPRGRGRVCTWSRSSSVASLLVDVGAVLTCAPVVAYRFQRVHLSLLVVAYRFVVAIGSVCTCRSAPRGRGCAPGSSWCERVSCVSSGSNMCTVALSHRQRVLCAPVAPRGRERARILRILGSNVCTCPAPRSRARIVPTSTSSWSIVPTWFQRPRVRVPLEVASAYPRMYFQRVHVARVFTCTCSCCAARGNSR